MIVFSPERPEVIELWKIAAYLRWKKGAAQGCSFDQWLVDDTPAWVEEWLEENRMDKLKMYILVREKVDTGLAVNSVGHASVGCYLKFEYHPEMQEWAKSSSFAKVTCVVSDGQFEGAKSVDDHIIIRERSLDGEEVSIAFRPRRDWPKHFKFYKLFGKHLKRVDETT